MSAMFSFAFAPNLSRKNGFVFFRYLAATFRRSAALILGNVSTFCRCAAATYDFLILPDTAL
jgi:hypothetical protein